MFLKLNLSNKERKQLKEVEKELAIKIIVAAQEALEESQLGFVEDLNSEDFVDLQELIMVNAMADVIL
jgi:hypothetical protein